MVDSSVSLIAADLQCTQDVAGDLDTFARLARAGHFARAQSFFDEALSTHKHLFPVAAEYGDMLIEQGAFGGAEEFLSEVCASTRGQQPANTEQANEHLILKLLHGIASIHTKMRVSDAVDTARDALSNIADDQDLDGINMQILVLSLRVLCYQTSYKLLHEPAHAAKTASTESQQPKSQPELLLENAERLHAVLDRLVTNDRSWDAVNLQSLRAQYHGYPECTPAWRRRFSAMCESPDAGVVLAGFTMLGNSSQAVLVQVWRDLLAESSATPPYILFLVHTQEILSPENPLADCKMDEIDDPLKTSRAYQYLRLLATDQELLKSIQDQSENLTVYTQPDSQERIREEVAEHAKTHGDFWLQNEVLVRQAYTTRGLIEKDFSRGVSTSWQDTKDSWSCVRLLATSQLGHTQVSQETKTILDKIKTFCQSPLEGEDPPPLPPLWEVEREHYNSQYQYCENALEVLNCWQRNSADNNAQNAFPRPLSLLETSIRSKAYGIQAATRPKFTPGPLQDSLLSSNVSGRWPQSGPESSNDAPVAPMTAKKMPRAHPKTLLFLGHTGTGKSSTINALTGSTLLTSDHTDPCTSEIAVVSKTLGKHEIECIDTPGFGDHRALATDLSVFFKLIGDNEDSGAAWKKVCFVYTHGIDPESRGRGIADKLRTQNVRFDDWRQTLNQAIQRGAHLCHLIEATGEDEAPSYIQEVRDMALKMLDSPGSIVLQCQIEMCRRHVPIDQTGAAAELITAIYQGDEELREAERQGKKNIAAKEQEVRGLVDQRDRKGETSVTPLASMARRFSMPSGPNPGATEPDKTAGNRSSAALRTPVMDYDTVRREAEKARIDAERLAEEAQKQAELELREQEAQITQLREELDELRRDQQAMKEKRAKFLREQKLIEESPHFLPRFMVFNRSNVTVHLRLYSEPFHLVWCYANNVIPGSFATLTCPFVGFYNIEVRLATGTDSEFTTAGQVLCTAGKITLGALTVYGGMFGGVFATALGAEVVAKGGAAALSDALVASAAFVGGTYGATDGNNRARRMFSTFRTNARKPNANIAIVAVGELQSGCYKLMQVMKKASDGGEPDGLVERSVMKLWRKKRITLRGGPDLVLDADRTGGSADRLKYRFTYESQPLTLEDREEFDDDAPSSPSHDSDLAYGSHPSHMAYGI
ncbi:hypothetical protein LTR57_015602 [Friedmanniomyces endolithicus]|nr:hypothetical protein LTR57_015602 [Friedmanniomyces endolithicus]